MMLLLYLQPYRTVSTQVGIFQNSSRQPDRLCKPEELPSARSVESLYPLENPQGIDRITQRYFLERRSFL